MIKHKEVLVLFNIEELLKHTEERLNKIQDYKQAYEEYCWDVLSIDDLKLAPFHILATDDALHVDKTNEWHMETIRKYFNTDDTIIKLTRYIKITDAEKSIEDGIDWWLNLTSNGGEGMVVKPNQFISFGKKGVIQPAIKCRGKEYLRIIYGPEYDFKENLEVLKKRGLGKKRSMAIKEFALGIEALERLVNNDPLYRVHQCVFGVLALESEAVDPRL